MVTASLRVGDGFEGDVVIRAAEHLDAFTAYNEKKSWDVVGFEGRDPAGMLRVDVPGVTIVGYRSKPWPHVIPAERFRKALREEGLPDVKLEGDVRERFIRYAKALLENGPGQDRPIGFRYEIVRESADTYRVLLEGQPMKNALVVAMQERGTNRIEGRTGPDGRVKLAIARPGVWLVKSVHILRAPAGSGSDWESLWASLTFQSSVGG